MFTCLCSAGYTGTLCDRGLYFDYYIVAVMPKWMFISKRHLPYLFFKWDLSLPNYALYIINSIFIYHLLMYRPFTMQTASINYGLEEFCLKSSLSSLG